MLKIVWLQTHPALIRMHFSNLPKDCCQNGWKKSPKAYSSQPACPDTRRWQNLAQRPPVSPKAVRHLPARTPRSQEGFLSTYQAGPDPGLHHLLGSESPTASYSGLGRAHRVRNLGKQTRHAGEAQAPSARLSQPGLPNPPGQVHLFLLLVRPGSPISLRPLNLSLHFSLSFSNSLYLSVSISFLSLSVYISISFCLCLSVSLYPYLYLSLLLLSTPLSLSPAMQCGLSQDGCRPVLGVSVRTLQHLLCG